MLQQPVAVLGEYCGHPHRLIHVHAHEPAKQQIVVQLLHQQPLAPNRIEDLQQQGPQQTLRRDRRASHVGVQLSELRRHVLEHAVHQRSDLM